MRYSQRVLALDLLLKSKGDIQKDKDEELLEANATHVYMEPLSRCQ